MQTADQAAKHLFKPEVVLKIEDRTKEMKQKFCLSAPQKVSSQGSPLLLSSVPIFRQYQVTCSSISNAAEVGHGMSQRAESV